MSKLFKILSLSIFTFSLFFQVAQAKKLEPLLTKAGVKAMSDDYNEILMEFLPTIKERIRNEVLAVIKKGMEAEKKSFQIMEYQGLKFDLQNKPIAMNYLGNDEVEFALPAKGGWNFRIQARLRMRLSKILRNTSNFYVKIENFSLRVRLKFVRNKNGHVRLYVTQEPQVNYNFKFRGTNFGNKILALNASAIMKRILKKKVKTEVAKLSEHLNYIHKYTWFAFAKSKSKNFLKENPVKDIEGIIKRVDRKIENVNLANGIIAHTDMKEKAYTSIIEAFSEGGPGAGEVRQYLHNGDGAIWTGHFLAGMAMKNKVLKDEESLSQVKKALVGIENLLEIYGNTGLLARDAAPVNSDVGRDLIKLKRVQIRHFMKGEDWIGYAGSNGISRDQYSGAFFGLITAYDYIDDADIKERSRKAIIMMLDYIIGNKWIVKEDRRPLTQAGNDSGPTLWAGINYQRLNMLLIGEHVAPGRYKKELDKYSNLAFSSFLGVYFAILTPVAKYYKYNLEAINFYTYFRLEKNEKRKAALRNVVQMLENYIGHHKNPFQDIIRAVALENITDAKKIHIRESFNKALYRGHRQCMPNSLYFKKFPISKIRFPDGIFDITPFALDPDKQESTIEFLWQRAPFRQYNKDFCEAHQENVNLGLSLPYWMGRLHGIMK